MLTSAELPPATFVPLMEVSFSLLSSGVEEEAVTVLISFVAAAPAETFTTMSNSAVVPAVSVAMEQFTVPPDPTEGVVQTNVGPVGCVYKTNVTPAGSGSLNAAFVASSGPPLPRGMVKVMFEPAVADAGAVFVTNMSAAWAAAETAARRMKTAAPTPRMHANMLDL